MDLARAELGIRNLESTASSNGSCTFDFVVPHSFEIACVDESNYALSEDAIVARSGESRVCMSGVVDPTRRTESDWCYFMFQGRVSRFCDGSSTWSFTSLSVFNIIFRICSIPICLI